MLRHPATVFSKQTPSSNKHHHHHHHHHIIIIIMTMTMTMTIIIIIIMIIIIILQAPSHYLNQCWPRWLTFFYCKHKNKQNNTNTTHSTTFWHNANQQRLTSCSTQNMCFQFSSPECLYAPNHIASVLFRFMFKPLNLANCFYDTDCFLYILSILQE